MIVNDKFIKINRFYQNSIFILNKTSFIVSNGLFIGFEMVNDIWPTRYGIYIIGLSSFVNVIFTARFMIFYVSRLIVRILPLVLNSILPSRKRGDSALINSSQIRQLSRFGKCHFQVSIFQIVHSRACFFLFKY